jgi:hypothetical protein
MTGPRLLVDVRSLLGPWFSRTFCVLAFDNAAFVGRLLTRNYTIFDG